jgi:hypothetical protein
MINTGILNPQILSLLARVRHTNALVIADRGFPFWPQIKTVDLSLVDGVPMVLQVLAAARANGTQNFDAPASKFCHLIAREELKGIPFVSVRRPLSSRSRFPIG